MRKARFDIQVIQATSPSRSAFALSRSVWESARRGPAIAPLLCWLMVACACLVLLGACLAPAAAFADERPDRPMLVVVVGFSGDGREGEVPYDISYDWGEDIFGPTDSMSSFYSELSDGKFTFVPVEETSEYGVDGNTSQPDRVNDGVVHVVLDEPHGDWGLVNEDSAIASEFGSVVNRALQKAASMVDLKSYDKDGDGVLTPNELVITFIIAGYDASVFADPARTDIPSMWPHSGLLSNAAETARSTGTITMDSYIALSEYLWEEGDPSKGVVQEPLGTLYHEAGHALGLPDLYSLNESGPWADYVVGQLSLMSNGGWAEDAAGRNRPTALDGWCRYMLGWSASRVVTSSGDYAVSSQGSGNGFSQLVIPSSDPDELFIVENRQPTGIDEGLASAYPDEPAGGVVVWHVDKGVYRDYSKPNTVNSGPHHPGIMEVFSGDAASPNVGEPFYEGETLELQLYASGEGGARDGSGAAGSSGLDSPADLRSAGITLNISSPSSSEMNVHVDMAQEAAGRAEHAYPDDEAARFQTCTTGSPLAAVAACSLLEETGAQISLVDAASIQAGLPEGEIKLAQAFGVMPSETRLACYELTGAQVVSLLEESANRAAANQEAGSVVHPDVLGCAGVSYVANLSSRVPTHVMAVQVGGKPIDESETYQVVVSKGVVDSYDAFNGLSPETWTLWGSPSDALRSFIQTDGWEAKAARADSESIVWSGKIPGDPASPVQSLPLVPIIVIVAVAFVVVGAVARVVVGRRG